MKRFYIFILCTLMHAQQIEHIQIPGENASEPSSIPQVQRKTDSVAPKTNRPKWLESDDFSMPSYMMPAPAHQLLNPSTIKHENMRLDGVAPQNPTPLRIAPAKPQAIPPNATIFYLMSAIPPCLNCRNFSNHKLRLFLGRLIFVSSPINLSFEPIKGSLSPDDVTSKDYQLSFEYYDSLQQLNAFFEAQIASVKQQLEQIELSENETLPTILRKLESQFVFVCDNNGKTYWEKGWVIDREILFTSAISAQKGGNVPHLSALMGACSLTPRAGELESEACAQWRKAINEYPPLSRCSVLGNAENQQGEILEH